jgi:hypothetical protein
MDSDEDEVDHDPTAQDHAVAYEARAADGWEPPRPSGAADEDADMEDPAAPGGEPELPPRAREQRMIAEDCFHEKPVIEKFPGGRAGQPMSNESIASAEQQYSDKLGATGNIYAPFGSKMDWEVARWAKLRGSGSTAFTDLLKIEGVRSCGIVACIQ